MRIQPETTTSPTQSLTLLSISPDRDDHRAFENIIGHSRWTLLTANNLFTARAYLLQHHDITVVVCERDLGAGTWRDILKQLQTMPHPPSLVVTSRLADERLWAEALNVGAWDVLAKPFHRTEVLRSIRSAWEHWYRQTVTAAKPTMVLTAAS